MRPPQLDQSDVYLRHLRSDDAESWLAYLLDPMVVALPSYDITSIADVSSMLAGCIAAAEAGPLSRWGIARRDDDVLVGTCGFHAWSPKDRRAELGYDLSRPYWGRGIATAAVAATITSAFAETELNRVEAFTRVDNFASQRVLEKTGFTNEGRLRSYRNCRGVFHDFYLFSRIRDGD